MAGTQYKMNKGISTTVLLLLLLLFVCFSAGERTALQDELGTDLSVRCCDLCLLQPHLLHQKDPAGQDTEGRVALPCVLL